MTLIPSSPYDEEVAFNLEDEEEIDTIVDHRRRVQVQVGGVGVSPSSPAKDMNKNTAAGKSQRDRQKLEGAFFIFFVAFYLFYFIGEKKKKKNNKFYQFLKI